MDRAHIAHIDTTHLPLQATLCFALPVTPNVSRSEITAHNSGSDGPQPSEELILGHIQALETIGYRTVGTPQARQGEIYVEEEVRKLADKCKKDGVLECDVWVQTGDGFHEYALLNRSRVKLC